jgi:hypothetical protein
MDKGTVQKKKKKESQEYLTKKPVAKTDSQE